MENNIVIVTQSTLTMALRIVTNIWNQEKQNKNALEIAKQSGALYDEFVRFYEDLTELGHHLVKAEEAYKGARDRLTTGRGNLARKAENIRKLGAKTSKALPQAIIDETSDS